MQNILPIRVLLPYGDCKVLENKVFIQQLIRWIENFVCCNLGDCSCAGEFGCPGEWSAGGDRGVRFGAIPVYTLVYTTG